MIAQSPVPVEVLPPDRAQCEACLHQLQVTARSALGTVALNTGGILVDHRWLRVYGGSRGSRRDAGAGKVNDFPAAPSRDGVPPHGLVIAHDVLGGVFALNLATSPACGRPGEPGEVVYFAPDSMAWEPMEGGYGTWITWMLSGKLGRFYESLRWPGWEAQATVLSPRQGLSVIPPLWSREARDDPADASRRPAAMRELVEPAPPSSPPADHRPGPGIPRHDRAPRRDTLLTAGSMKAGTPGQTAAPYRTTSSVRAS